MTIGVRGDPRLPDGICIYAVSDIHGCADELAKVFAAIDHHLFRVEPKRPIHVFLGDYIDRGPASSQVIDMLIERGRQHETIFLKGNHEALLAANRITECDMSSTGATFAVLHLLQINATSCSSCDVVDRTHQPGMNSCGCFRTGCSTLSAIISAT